MAKFTGSSDRKNRDPAVSATTTVLPYLLHFTRIIGFLWTLKALIRVNFFSSSPTNLTIPSEKPTTSSLPLFFLENGSQSIQVASPSVENFLL